MTNSIVNHIHSLFIKKHRTVAVAESCTGGLVSYLLTSRSGSSAYFKLGAVVYSNKVKQSILKIPAPLLESCGAVSFEVAKAMACSIRRIGKTDYSLSITGIAGPTGGTKQKPVGTVFICAAAAGKLINKRFLFRGSRASVRRQSALQALKLLKRIMSF